MQVSFFKAITLDYRKSDNSLPMRRRFSFIDYTLISVGLVSIYLGVRTMLEIPTLILPSWFLTIMFGAILLIVSFLFGALISSLSKLKVHLLTATSVVVTIVCLAFYINEYRPTCKIYVPDTFTGEVKLFHSTLANNNLSLNKYGVGYITDKAYRKGFKPVVYQNGKDITEECKNFGQGSVAFVGVDGTNLGPFSYVGFTIKNNTADTLWTDLKKVIEQKIIDTSIMKK
jgi:hypothetical protein